MNYFVGVVIIWALAFGLPASWLAAEKGRSRIAWFVVGAIFGPMAVLILGFAPTLAEGMYTACDECLEAMLVGATTCPHCGSDQIENDETDS